MRRVAFFSKFRLAALIWVAAGAAHSEELRIGTNLAYSHPTVALETATPLGRVEYSPTLVTRPGVEARYGGFGFSMTLPAPGGEWASAGGSPSEGLNDFRTHWHGSDWGFEAHHRHARGFTARPEFSREPMAVYHPDMTLRLTDVTVYRALDPDSRVYRLSEGRAATGGGVDFFVTAAASHTRLRDEVALLERLLPAGEATRFDGVRGADVASLAVGGGYAVSGNLHGLYIDQALFAGYGPQFRSWDRLWERENDVAWNLVKVNLRLRMGLRTRWFDAGAGFENDAHAVFDGNEKMITHALVARAGFELFL